MLTRPHKIGVIYLLTQKAFHEINLVGILWTDCHLWPSIDHFFNCFHHWLLLVLRNGNRTASLLHIRDDVTQGDPLAMVSYGIVVLSLIKQLKVAYLEATQP